MKIIIFILCFPLFTLGQNNINNNSNGKLYGIMAYIDSQMRIANNPSNPTLQEEKEEEYHKLLLQIESGTIKVIDTLNTHNGLRMNTLLHFPDQGYFYFEEQDLFSTECPNYYSVLDYQNGLVLRRFNSERDPSFKRCMFLGQAAVWKNDKVVYINEDTIVNGRLVEYGRDRFFNRYKINLEDFNHLYQYGISGFQHGISFSYNYPYDNYSKLKITRVKEYSEMPDAFIQLPDSLNSRNYFVYVRLNNDNYFAAVTKKMNQKHKDSFKIVLLYNKNKDSWKKIKIPGSSGIFRYYDDFLYGTKVDVNSDYYRSDMYEERMKLEKKIDNKYQPRYNFDNGKPPTLFNREGKFYLYDLRTDKLIEWKVSDRDSEIIIIEDGIIYYRVFDELRTVELDTDKRVIKWKTDKLLVKNADYVPYIHWIFHSTGSEVKEVFVN